MVQLASLPVENPTQISFAVGVISDIAPRMLKAKAALALLLAIFTSHIATATLIICAYHNERMYLGSDSLRSGVNGSSNAIVQKIFQISPTACAAICNDYGVTFTRNQTNVLLEIDLPSQLGRLAKRTAASGAPVATVISNIISGFATFYCSYSNRVREANLDKAGTGLACCGYDPENSTFFFGYGSYGTSAQPFEVRFKWNSHTNGGRGDLTFLGSIAFSKGLVSPIAQFTTLPDDAYKPLRTPKLVRLVKALYSARDPLSDEDVVTLFLLLFQLHAKYSSELTPAQAGGVGEPYVIYKINSEGVVKLH